MDRVVLDTSSWVEVEKKRLDIRIFSDNKFQIILPAIVIGELKYSAWVENRSNQQLQSSLDFIHWVESSCEFAPVDQAVAARYAELKYFSRQQGRPRTDTDLLIAATAVEYKARLHSADKKADFGSLPNVLLFS